MADVVAYIHINQIETLNVESAQSARGEAAFSTSRLLVGSFTLAEQLLTRLTREVHWNRFFISAPRLVIQPLAMFDGGLCEVEEKIFTELGLAAGARSVRVYVGQRLTAAMAKDVLAGKASR